MDINKYLLSFSVYCQTVVAAMLRFSRTPKLTQKRIYYRLILIVMISFLKKNVLRCAQPGNYLLLLFLFQNFFVYFIFLFMLFIVCILFLVSMEIFIQIFTEFKSSCKKNRVTYIILQLNKEIVIGIIYYLNILKYAISIYQSPFTLINSPYT